MGGQTTSKYLHEGRCEPTRLLFLVGLDLGGA